MILHCDVRGSTREKPPKHSWESKAYPAPQIPSPEGKYESPWSPKKIGPYYFLGLNLVKHGIGAEEKPLDPWTKFQSPNGFFIASGTCVQFGCLKKNLVSSRTCAAWLKAIAETLGFPGILGCQWILLFRLVTKYRLTFIYIYMGVKSWVVSY